MGVEDYLVTSTVVGVVAQRLVRTLCEHCREPYRPDAELVRELELERLAGVGPITLFRARGCEHCENSGYRGRTTVMETMLMDEELARVVLHQGDVATLRASARERGAISMYDNGLRKALTGTTSLEEVARVTRAQ